MSNFSRFMKALGAGIGAAQDYHRLSVMSDGALRARGLDRGDLPAHVRRAWFDHDGA